MKTVKRTLSVLLCCILLAAFAPLAHAGDKLIEQAYATYTVPEGGDTFDFSQISVPLEAQYTAKIAGVNYLDEETKKPVSVKNGDTVIAGVTYNVSIRFEAKYGYVIDSEKTEFIVNGETVTNIIAEKENIVQTSFTAKGETPAEPEPSKPTLRDRVATFFRDMRNRFLFLIFWLRSLFGIKKV